PGFYTLSLHDALPILAMRARWAEPGHALVEGGGRRRRSSGTSIDAGRQCGNESPMPATLVRRAPTSAALTRRAASRCPLTPLSIESEEHTSELQSLAY